MVRIQAWEQFLVQNQKEYKKYGKASPESQIRKIIFPETNTRHWNDQELSLKTIYKDMWVVRNWRGSTAQKKDPISS